MAGGQAAAQWPERPVTLIVPFPAGGGTDTFARPLAQQLTQQLGHSVVIDNKGGAGGTVGAGVAAKARPDGYTFFMGGAHHALAPSLYKSLNYNIQKDFVPVALVAQPPQVVVINASKLPVKTLQEFIDYAKKRPGDINFGTAGKGSTHHLAGELFAMQTGIKLVDVPYQGAGPMLSALIGGQVDLAFDGLGSSSNHIRSGTIKPLAVAASERSPSLPDVPTAAEAGVPNYVVSTWYAIWAPAGTQGGRGPHDGGDHQGPEHAQDQGDLDQQRLGHSGHDGRRFRPVRRQRGRAGPRWCGIPACSWTEVAPGRAGLDYY